MISTGFIHHFGLVGVLLDIFGMPNILHTVITVQYIGRALTVRGSLYKTV